MANETNELRRQIAIKLANVNASIWAQNHYPMAQYVIELHRHSDGETAYAVFTEHEMASDNGYLESHCIYVALSYLG